MTKALRLLGLLLLGLLLGACAEQTPDDPRLNLVLISIDTLRADHLGCYGYARRTSPAIDAFAESSVLFEQAYSQAPVTAPSHMTIFTGLYPEAHGVANWTEGGNRALSATIPTLATILEEHGYRSIGFTGGAHMRPELGFGRGFEHYADSGNPVQAFSNAMQAMKQLSDRQAAGDPSPFFIFLHTFAVHDPYLPPLEFRSRFIDPEYRGRIVGDRAALMENTKGGFDAMHDAFWERVDPASPEDLQHLTDLYDAGIAFVDHWIGRLLRRLEELGLEDRTLVVILSDHGEAFLEHGNFLHANVFQEVLHVPLLIHFPGSERTNLRGTSVSGRVRLVDVMPTLLSAFDIPIPAHVQGRSLLPRIAGKTEDGGPILSQWPDEDQHAIRVGDWKLSQQAGSGNPMEALYDLEADPGERANRLAAEPETAERLRARLRELRDESRAIHESTGEGAAVGLDAPLRERLEALGYLEGE